MRDGALKYRNLNKILLGCLNTLGTSVVNNGVANVPISNGNTLGVVKIGTTNGFYGIRVDVSGNLFIEKTTSAGIK